MVGGVNAYFRIEAVVVGSVLVLCHCGAYLKLLLHDTETVQGFVV